MSSSDKLYPPFIEGKLPACAGTVIKIPITMNRSVSQSDVGGMRLMIKTVQTNVLKATLVGALSYENGRYYATFDLTNADVITSIVFTPTLGQYYKFQVAYVNKNGVVGYYSSIGIAKYTSQPNIYIQDLRGNLYGGYEYVGIYSQRNSTTTTTNQSGESNEVTIYRDSTEKIYSYCFEITDSNENLIATSGVQLHNSAIDVSSSETRDTWTLNMDLEKNKIFYISYKVTSINGLEKFVRYPIIQQDSIDADLPVSLIAKLNEEDACISLYFYPSNNENDRESNVVINGNFLLSRASSIDNFKSWQEIYRFSYANVSFLNKSSILLWEDFTVQQGEEYIYALQVYNNENLYSNKILNVNNVQDMIETPIYVDFEDSYLYDGEKQLKIRFNPKVSSFKSTVMESKVNTIGSQYPFVFRGSKVDYKEFPISGLISLIGDESERFFKGIQATHENPKRLSTPSSHNPHALDTNLTAHNIKRERQFKLEVLNWLNNGQPKIFKSPTEGNYIVRLMNVTLTPNDTLGRMLHTFSCQACEIEEYTFDNLISLGIIKLPDGNTTRLKVGQVSLDNMVTCNEELMKRYYPHFHLQENNTIATPAIWQAKIYDASPGTIFELNFADNSEVASIEIGTTGVYEVQIVDRPLSSIALKSGGWNGAKLTFSYYEDSPVDAFNQIKRIDLTDEIRQFIGTGLQYNIIDYHQLGDIRRELGQFHFIRVVKRDIVTVWTSNGKYYLDEWLRDEILDKDWNATAIYYVTNERRYLDGHKNKPMQAAPTYEFQLNPKNANDYIDFGGRMDTTEGDYWGDTAGRFDALRGIEKVTDLRAGTGLIIDVSYRVRIKEYGVETSDATVQASKLNWENSVRNFKTGGSTLATINTNYSNFLHDLSVALQNQRRT